MPVPHMTTVDEARAERERALSRVEQAVQRGEDPRSTFTADDLEWLFGSDPAELERLVEQAAEVRLAERERLQAIDERQRFERMVKKVRDERDGAERAKLRKLDEAEARRRLEEES